MSGSISFILAAPASNSGKTTITLALLRHLKNQSINVKSFKVGPDYIDPAFHAAASGHNCPNIDGWAMSKNRQRAIFKGQCKDTELVIGEGVMGLFDGAQNGTGSTGDVSETLNIPVILIVNAKGQSQSVAALIQGFKNFRTSTKIAGVIFNNVGSDKHRQMLQSACDDIGTNVYGFVPANTDLVIKERHLGLVQAEENPDLEAFLDKAADIIENCIDISALLKIAPVRKGPTTKLTHTLPVLGQHIAIARDQAFSFVYPHLLSDWMRTGVELSFFSPLNDEGPDKDADAIYLPGGYPELHAEQLSNCYNFFEQLTASAALNKAIYGECGGYMVLGDSLTTADGIAHKMAELLPVATSFEKRKRHLGYRCAELTSDCILGRAGDMLKAHEFHYCSTITDTSKTPLFNASNAVGDALGSFGAINGSVAGSFLHLIDRTP